MDTKFTPGPWWTDGEYDHDDCGVTILAANTDAGPLPGNPTRGMVAAAIRILPDEIERCIADARLIAAAPELYELLAECNRRIAFESVGLGNDFSDRVEAALAKARGEA